MADLKRLVFAGMLAAGLVTLLPARGYAQPQTPLDEPPGGATPPIALVGQPVAPQAQVAASVNGAWSATAGLFETYDNNVALTTTGERTLGNRVMAALGYDWQLHRGGIRVGGSVDRLFYRKVPDLDTFAYGVSTGASYALTRRLNWNFGESLSSAYAQDTPLLTEQGLIFPKVLTRTNVATTQLSYTASRKTRFGTGFAFQDVSFDKTSSLASGSSQSAEVDMSRQVTASQQIGGFAQYQRTVTDGTVGSIASVLANWRMGFGRRSSLVAAGGIGVFTLPGDSRASVSPSASVALNLPLRQSDALVLTYQHTIEQGIGVGATHTSHIFGGSYATVVRRFLFSASTAYGIATYADTDRGFKALTFGAQVGYTLIRRFGVTAAYSRDARSDQLVTTASSSRASLALTYSTKWRR